MATTAKMINKKKTTVVETPAPLETVENVEGAIDVEPTPEPEVKPEVKPKAKPEAKQKKKQIEDTLISVSQEVESLGREKALELANTLIETVGFNSFRLGGVLSVIQANNFWEGSLNVEGVPYDSFKSFMAGQYGMQYRKGMYLIQIYNSLIASQVPWELVADLGWTKLKELAEVLTKENVLEWVERAKSMTTIQLIDYIKNRAAGKTKTSEGVEGDTAKLTTMTFKLHEDQKQLITDALEIAMKQNETDVQAKALEYISMSYMETLTGKAKPITATSLVEQLKCLDEEVAFAAIEKAFPQYNISVEEAPEEGDDDAM